MDNVLITSPPQSHADPASLWDKALASIQPTVPRGSFEAWFAHARPLAFDGSTLTLEVSSSFCYDWVRERFQDTIEKTLAEIAGRPVALAMKVSPDARARALSALSDAAPRANDTAAPASGGAASSATTERPPAVETVYLAPARTAAAQPAQRHEPVVGAGARRPQLNPRYTFSTFVVGGSNEFAYAACKAIAERPGTAYNPVFIYGGVGLGKTHLIQAIGHAVLEKDPRTRVFYMSAEAWMNEMISAIQNGTTLLFKEKFRNADFFLLDDVPFLSGKESTQQELFHTFNVLIDSRKQIVLTSDRPPHEISDLEGRLVSRFQAGLVVDIQSPDLEMRLAILRKRAAAEGIDLEDDVSLLIADSVKSNVRELEGSLVRLLAYSSLTGRDITLDLARQVLKDYLSSPSRKNTVEQIQAAVVEFFSLPHDAMRSRRRTTAIAHPRQIAMYLAREMTGLSLTDIGRKFGGRDHTTVLHACDKIRDDMSRNPTVSDAISRLRTQLER